MKGERMNKLEVQQRVLRDGKPLDLSLFEWDEKTLTFSSRENELVIDFNGSEHCTFKTGWDCTFDTGWDCTFIINGYKFPVCPPRFNGSKYSIYINEPDSLTAGCVTKPLSWWKENVRRCAEENSCTPDQQDEAELYVQMAELWLNKYSSQIIKESA